MHVGLRAKNLLSQEICLLIIRRDYTVMVFLWSKQRYNWNKNKALHSNERVQCFVVFCGDVDCGKVLA